MDGVKQKMDLSQKTSGKQETEQAEQAARVSGTGKRHGAGGYKRHGAGSARAGHEVLCAY